jgi:dihydrofolate synthase / folylpolyglutamate synthase
VSGPGAAVIAARSAELGSPLEVLGRDFTLAPDSDGRLAYRSRAGTIAPLALALPGAHQHRNAALAVRALELVPVLTPTHAEIAAGLAAVRWPGRLQVVCERPLVILDGAHNAAGIEALVAEVRACAAGRRVRVLFGVMRDKGWQSMLRALGDVAADVVLTRPRQPRSVPPETLAAAVTGAVQVIEDPEEAYRALLASSGPDDVVIVTGSLFLIGDVLPSVDPTLVPAAARERAAARLAGRC